jgi:hypothetical protein
MGWKRVGVLGAIAILFGTGTATAEATDIVVRVFNNYGVPPDDLRDAQTYAAAALSGAGVNVTWINCWHGALEAADAPARCREDVGGDLVLRLQRAATANGDRYVSLGFALVMPEGTPFLATVYADLAEGVAMRAGVAAQPVLGRAIAHELGHLLLNTNSHPDDGLMRGTWSQQELRRNVSRDWEFQEQEAASLRAAVAQRRQMLN